MKKRLTFNVERYHLKSLIGLLFCDRDFSEGILAKGTPAAHWFAGSQQGKT